MTPDPATRDAATAPQPRPAARRDLFVLLASCAAIEALAFVWLFARDGDMAFALATHSDSLTYARVGVHLAETGEWIGGQRTPGYPLFIALASLVAGPERWLPATIAAQLVLNLVWTALAWQLSARLLPDLPRAARATGTLVVFWMGLGLALVALSDHLATVLFGIAITGFLFWRSPPRLLLAASCLAAATATRPSFTLAPLVLLILAWLTPRFSTPLAMRWVALFAAGSIAATSLSIGYQRAYNDYRGISDVLTLNYERTLYLATQPAESYAEHRRAFAREIEARAGGELGDLSKNQREEAARQIFLEAVTSRPGTFVAHVARTLAKYLTVPSETFVRTLAVGMRARDPADVVASRSAPGAGLRAVQFALWLPLLLLAYCPPIAGPARLRWYYLSSALLLAWIVGQASVLSPGQGERMRLPVMLFFAPIGVANGLALVRRFAARRRARSD